MTRRLRYTKLKAQRLNVMIAGGFAEVNANGLTVLAERVEA